MEVKDFLNEGTVELSKEEKQTIYKDIQRYINSKDYEKLVEFGRKEGDKLLEKIRKEVKERKKTELVKSKLDQLINYIELLEAIKVNIDDSKGGIIIKKHIDTDIKRANDNIEIKVDDFWDAPIYSKADMLKMTRANFMTIPEKISAYSNVYTEVKEEKMQLMHPYEENN